MLFIKGSCGSRDDVIRQTTEAAISWVAEGLSGLSDREVYLDKFRWFCKKERLCNTMEEAVNSRTPLSVICHGDCWTNNLMFKYVDGQVADVSHWKFHAPCIINFALADLVGHVKYFTL